MQISLVNKYLLYQILNFFFNENSTTTFELMNGPTPIVDISTKISQSVFQEIFKDTIDEY